jgi:hypothetical protein
MIRVASFIRRAAFPGVNLKLKIDGGSARPQEEERISRGEGIIK